MSDRSSPPHVVVDGSNIATEGRSLPSLRQLNDAVLAYMDEHPKALVTVVVDATFGHRIDSSESKEYEAGIANNELVAPPAGAVGRGDAFVLSIADKANATVLSNDSFQEFHGEYDWLFDEGRLVGGKPVPHVGWVFVERVPVRGPTSRKATRSKSGGMSRKKSSTTTSRGRGRRKKAAESIDASGPPPTPTAPPPGVIRPAERRVETSEPDDSRDASTEVDTGASTDAAATPKPAPRKGEAVNDLVPFLEFVEHHPVGTSVTGIVESYSSHGAYVEVNGADVRAYVPLRLMADPPPRSARSVLELGDTITMVVASFTADRRSIDCALPDMAPSEHAAGAAGDGQPPAEPVDEDAGSRDEPTKSKRPAKKTSAKKAAAKKAAAKKATTKRTAAKKAVAKKAAAKKATTKRTAAKKAVAKKAAAKKAAAETVTTPADDAAASAASGETGAANNAVAEKAPAKTPARNAATKKAATKKAATKKAATGKAATGKTSAKKAATSRSSSRRRAAAAKPAEATSDATDAAPAGDG